MSNITDIFFTVSFLSMLFIFGYKLYNLLSGGKVYDLKGTFLLFIGFLVAYLVTLVSFLIYPLVKIYMIMFLFSSFLLIIVALFSVIEFIIFMAAVGLNPKRANRFSNREA